VISPGEAKPNEAVAPSRRVPEAEGGAEGEREVVPGAAPKDAGMLFNYIFKYIYTIIIASLLSLPRSVIIVPAPFINIPQHVEQAQIVR
jgi:hypothetical protein